MDAVPLDVNDSQVDEAQELEEDLRLAEKVAPFFCKFLLYASTTHFIFKVEEPDLRKDQYHTMMWYLLQSRYGLLHYAILISQTGLVIFLQPT